MPSVNSDRSAGRTSTRDAPVAGMSDAAVAAADEYRPRRPSEAARPVPAACGRAWRRGPANPPAPESGHERTGIQPRTNLGALRLHPAQMIGMIWWCGVNKNACARPLPHDGARQHASRRAGLFKRGSARRARLTSFSGRARSSSGQNRTASGVDKALTTHRQIRRVLPRRRLVQVVRPPRAL